MGVGVGVGAGVAGRAARGRWGTGEFVVVVVRCSR